VFNKRQGPGIRTRVLLLTSLVLIIAGTTASSLLIVRSRLQHHVQEALAEDLRHSVETFQDIEAHRRSALDQESSLLASLPSLKALMTTSDPRTITDDAVDFWKTSGNDLFALADANTRILSANAEDVPNTERLKHDLQTVIDDPSSHYLLSGGRLYEYSVRPLYFGSAATGTLLGYVVSGYAVDHRLLQEVGRGAGAEAAFIAGSDIVASTLPKEKRKPLQGMVASLRQNSAEIMSIGSERYLASIRDVTNGAVAPLRLVVMKSFDEADRTEREINRLVFLASLLAIVVGSLLMLLLARMVTRPLELLATGVRAFGEGDPKHLLPSAGTQEVRYLSRVFSEMRDEIQKKNRALVESERLATIGRMASSVSHDLRHYLAAVYANAEFLASPVLPASERAELFDEIRLAVNGTTDMLDSLLIFGRTGAALQQSGGAMRFTETPLEDWVFSPDYAVPLLENKLGVLSLEGFGLQGRPAAATAAGAIWRSHAGAKMRRATMRAVIFSCATWSAAQCGPLDISRAASNPIATKSRSPKIAPKLCAPTRRSPRHCK